MTFQKHAGAVRRFMKMLRFGAWFQNLPNKVVPPPFRLMQIGAAFWQSRTLYVAARLDIASHLGDESLHSDEIAARVSAHPDATYRLLRMLAAMGVFEEAGEGYFRNNTLSSFLRTDNPKNVRAMILMHNSEVMSRPWYEQLERGVRDGSVPFALTHGEQLFAYMDRHPEFDALFAAAMNSVDELTGDSYAVDFDWSPFERVIDVGGSRGSKSVTLLKHYPHLRALVMDRAQIVIGASEYWQRNADASVVSRLQFQPGDALLAVPPATSPKDIYLLSAVLHGLGDDEAVAVLRNVATAIADTGARVAVLEMLMPETGADLGVASFDMQMFMGTQGRERTLKEWQRIFNRSGLKREEVVHLRTLGKIQVLRN